MFNNHRYEEPSLLPGWLTTILYILLFIVIIVMLIRIARGSLPLFAYGSWTHVINDFTYSSKEFYQKLEKKLRDKDVKDVTIGFESLYEGSYLASPARNYLKVTWRDKMFYVCAAPFGSGFFISWWHFEKTPVWEQLVMLLGKFGRWIILSINPMTFYRIDTARVFQRYMHDAVVATMDEIAKEKSIRIEPGEKPVMYDPFNRK